MKNQEPFENQNKQLKDFNEQKRLNKLINTCINANELYMEETSYELFINQTTHPFMNNQK